MRDMQDEAGAPLTAAHESTPAAHPAQHRRSSLFLLMGATAVVSYVADQATKVWALNALTPGDPVELVGEFIRLNLIRNAGAAFSIGNGATWIMTLIACGVLVFILATARRIGSRGWAWALGLLLGGALGNMTDRLFREPSFGMGHVVDFIQLPNFAIFNIADSAVVSAVAIICILTLRGVSIDGARHAGTREKPGDA